MREVITMTLKAQKRAKILEMVKNKKIKQKDAAIILGICRRQLIRIFKEYLSKGDEALNHKLIGKPGNHRISSDIKEKIMQIVRNNYKGFKPTFIAEKLYEEHHIKIEHQRFVYG
ncbi:helix-turn-helix domain-containing protein [Thermospira aquatica]|uniref:Helix-turn-helix domain-containing protein n=1 Tax=Thermospira aquatica TaxID=2828656 RepID=A0AAX3BBH1_9SPIR|nr:helix-turn-helix domain-containing protein [Thermospira aquatica]URA09560.1 helix-turn-helix domain-containing protein [Thermospira aquatica]